MTTTNTYGFSPAASSLVAVAFSRIGLRRSEITMEHMSDADSESNLLQAEITSRQPNLWESQLQQLVLTPGTAAYALPLNVIAIQAAFISITAGSGAVDRIIWPLSAFEYAALPNKTFQSPPTMYWMNRLAAPTITFWPVPDNATTYTANIRMLSQVQDSSLKTGATLDLPYRFLDVYVCGMAHRLARIYAPDKEQLRKADYIEAWANAVRQDVEDTVSIYIQPDFTGYVR